MTNLDSVEKQKYHFSNKSLSSQSYGFSGSHVQCESWTLERLSTEEFMPSSCGAGEDS